MLLKILGSHSAIHANVTKRRRCIRTDCAQRRRPAYGKNIYVALARGTGFVQFVSLFRLRVLSRIAIFIRRIPARVCFKKKIQENALWSQPLLRLLAFVLVLIYPPPV